MELQMIAKLAPILGAVGFVIAIVIYQMIKAQPVGNERMKEISDAIHSGAMAFLGREYRVLSVFIVLVFFLIFMGMNMQTALAFVGGALCSMILRFHRHEGRYPCQRAYHRGGSAVRAGQGSGCLI